MKNPTDIAAKWAARLAASGDAIKAGVAAVTQSPMEQAAKQKSAWVSGIQKAADSGKWERGLRRVSLADWQNKMQTLGADRVRSGANAARPKMEAFLSAFLPHLDQLKTVLASMPRGDLSANIARAVRTIEHNASFKRS